MPVPVGPVTSKPWCGWLERIGNCVWLPSQPTAGKDRPRRLVCVGCPGLKVNFCGDGVRAMLIPGRDYRPSAFILSKTCFKVSNNDTDG